MVNFALHLLESCVIVSVEIYYNKDYVQKGRMMSLDLDSTEIAFSRLNDLALIKSFLLLKSISFKPIVTYGPRIAGLAIKLKLPVKKLIKVSIYDHFCGGESISDCSEMISYLSSYNVGTILDYASEGIKNEDAFEKTYEETIDNIRLAVSQGQKIPFCVFKPSGIIPFELMEKLSSNIELSSVDRRSLIRGEDRFNRICKAAYESGVRIMIDAEESWIQSYVDDLVEAAMHQYNRKEAIIYNTVQMYRTDRMSYLERIYRESLAKGFVVGVKLVRGAYLEKETERAHQLGKQNPLFKKKSDTDAAYDDALRFMMNHLAHFSICAATHNEKSTKILADLIDQNSLKHSDERFEFAQLLGMSDHITFNLSRSGFNASKYMPYGPIEDLLPYLSRRAQENSSIQGQASRELKLIQYERNRRRLLKSKGRSNN